MNFKIAFLLSLHHVCSIHFVSIILISIEKKFIATVDVVSRITGCVYILLDEPDSISSKSTSPNKVNIGLELKFTKRNQIVCFFLLSFKISMS